MGFYNSPLFSVSLKRSYYNIRTDFNQWYCSPNGRAKLIGEINEMEKFPFDVFLQQNTNGDISYLTVIRMSGVEHDVLLTYDYDHPDFEMKAKVLRPMLDMNRMRGHYYGTNELCYLHDWSRKYRAIHVAMQVTFWMSDYYKGPYCSGFSDSGFIRDNSSFLDRMQSRISNYYGRRY